MGAELGFSSTDLTLLATAISEVARNVTTYAGEGEVALRVIHERAAGVGDEHGAVARAPLAGQRPFGDPELELGGPVWGGAIRHGST